MEFKDAKDRIADALHDIVTYDTPRDQKISLKELDILVRLTHDIFGTLNRTQATELRQMIAEAKKKK